MPCGQKKRTQGDDPQPDGYAAIGGDGRDNVEIEDRDDEEKDEVPAAQDAAQMGRVLCGGRDR